MPDAGAGRDALVALYRQTAYRVDLPDGPVLFRVDEPLPAALEAALEGRPASFMTAANPFSRLLAEPENRAREQALMANLLAAGWAFWTGQGAGPDPAWPPERSVLVLGMAAGEAMPLAEAFDQYAFVCLEPGRPARLVFTRHWAAP